VDEKVLKWLYCIQIEIAKFEFYFESEIETALSIRKRISSIVQLSEV